MVGLGVGTMVGPGVGTFVGAGVATMVGPRVGPDVDVGEAPFLVSSSLSFRFVAVIEAADSLAVVRPVGAGPELSTMYFGSSCGRPCPLTAAPSKEGFLFQEANVLIVLTIERSKLTHTKNQRNFYRLMAT